MAGARGVEPVGRGTQGLVILGPVHVRRLEVPGGHFHAHVFSFRNFHGNLGQKQGWHSGMKRSQNNT